MSRVGKHAVGIPQGVEVAVKDQVITARGKLGELSLRTSSLVTANVSGGEITVTPVNSSKPARSLWGTTRACLENMMVGVSKGFTKELEINGVGYRAAVQGTALNLQLGYSHEINYRIPEGIAIKCEKPTSISISGFDKEKVGQVAAEIRAFRPPEPYKGKGIKYVGEQILRKEGKKK